MAFVWQHSRIYRGQVWHRRNVPQRHVFTMASTLLYLDLREFERYVAGASLAERVLLSAQRGLLAIREQDYLPGLPGATVRERVLHWLNVVQGVPFVGDVWLLTAPRALGITMNPISLFYCIDNDGALQHVIAEVTNTPWEERVLYHWPCDEQQGSQYVYRFAKTMHVSPFNPMALRYLAHWSVPDETLQVSLQLEADAGYPFAGGLQLRSVAFSHRALREHLLRLLRMPVMTALGIYWHALRLWLKRVPLYRHPGKDVAIPSEKQPIKVDVDRRKS